MIAQNILLFGGTGMLGREVQSIWPQGMGRLVALGSKDCDIANLQDVRSVVQQVNPDIIINCAAYTAVDAAEDDALAADRINHLGPANLAQVAAEMGALLVHVSTDYVFDGSASVPYTEQDTTSPLGVYGSTKLAGEQAIAQSGCVFVIVRTQWLYSAIGKNFFLTMLRLFAQKDSMNIVADQTGSPTYARDLAAAIFTICATFQPGMEGIYHYSDGGDCTWYDFASAIAALSAAHTRLHPVSSDQYPTKAHRPAYSVLSKDKIAKVFGVDVPHWRESLVKCYERYVAQNPVA